MSLFDRPILTVPRAVFAERADEVSTSFDQLTEHQRAFLSGVAGSSPYLARLLGRERDWLVAHANTPVDELFSAVIDEIDPSDAAGALRQAKRRVALITALGDLSGSMPLAEVTGKLTAFADHAVSVALHAALLIEVSKGKLPGMSQANVDQNACGMVVLAMGKMGAGELNYSSDIDLVVLFDETQHNPDDFAELRAGFVRATRRMVALLSETTDQGYVFRTDLRLRPDPAVTPVCIAMEPAERYYESLGRTWERAAYIKARAAAGDLKAGEAFLDRLKPFIWRKHLDYAALQDAHDMVGRIREHKGLLGAQEFKGLDVKLGPGGIREIEFFAQTQQLIFGGRKPSLRKRGTIETLNALVALEQVEAADAAMLIEAYEAHRGLEHRLQMLEDAQTHHIPKSDAGIDQVAALCGFGTAAELEADVLERGARVQEVTAPVEQPEHSEAETPSVTDSFGADALALIERWSYMPALNAARAREIFETLKPELLARLSLAANPDEALFQFDAFLGRLPAGVQLFSLFKENAQLLDLLVDICSTSPRLASYLGRNAGVLDAVIDRDFFEPLGDAKALESELSGWLSRVNHYEDVLDTARKWRKEQSFRTGVHLLRGLTDPAGAAASYSAIAEACLRALLPHIEAEVARRYGVAPGHGAAVIAMGKLGSREMTVSSDLDLIVVYDPQGEISSSGPKELATSTYFAKFTQSLILALTAQTAQGSLYEVDMRLRPSGRKGPVAVSLESFCEYQKTQAWTWESLALTRGRVVCGKPELRRAIEAGIHEALSLPRDVATVRSDVAEMRGRILKAKPAEDAWDVKAGPGGLLDLEMLVQTGLLVNRILDVHSPFEGVEALDKAGFWEDGERAEVLEGLTLRRSLQQLVRLISETDFKPSEAGTGTRDLILTRTGAESLTTLEKRLGANAATCAAIFAGKLTER